jgi:hypothetical protein
VLRVVQEIGVRHDDRGDRSQPLDHLSRLVEPSHVGEARSKKTIRQSQAQIFLDHGAVLAPLIKTPTDEISASGGNRIEFRIGVHQGDIVVEDGDIWSGAIPDFDLIAGSFNS